MAIDTAELLAGIYAHPDDDARRAVYADALDEQNDPRAEVIRQQLADANAGHDRCAPRTAGARILVRDQAGELVNAKST